MNSREQRFAKDIYDQVVAYGQLHPIHSKEREQYGSMAHKLPILVRSAGLVQALAFVHSRGKAPHQELLNHLAQVVLDDVADADRLLSESRTAGLQEYTYLMDQTMMALNWFKRFAQSVLKVGPTDEGEET